MTGLNVEFPRRQAMLSIYESPEYYPWQDVAVTRFCKPKEVARVPVFVWPMPTSEGMFVVEHQDGTVQRVQPDSLTFLGSKEIFGLYARGRDVYTAKVNEYVPMWQLEQLKEKLEEYDNYIQWLCQFVPEDRWDEVYSQITRMGIDYIGADDV